MQCIFENTGNSFVFDSTLDIKQTGNCVFENERSDCVLDDPYQVFIAISACILDLTSIGGGCVFDNGFVAPPIIDTPKRTPSAYTRNRQLSRTRFR